MTGTGTAAIVAPQGPAALRQAVPCRARSVTRRHVKAVPLPLGWGCQALLSRGSSSLISSLSKPRAVRVAVGSPPEWTPPDRGIQDTPSTPPEFTPPSENPGIPSSPPEFSPPADPNATPEEPSKAPKWRPARPDIPDPERDPLRKPARPPEVEPEPETDTGPDQSASFSGFRVNAFTVEAEEGSSGGEEEDVEEDLEEEEEEEEEDLDRVLTEEDISGLVQDYISFCKDQFQIENAIHIEPGVNGMPKVHMKHPNGSELEIYMHGANVVSWSKPDGSEMLYTSEENNWDGIKPLEGGIPIIFPQYNSGPLPFHGLLRDAHWSLIETAVGPAEAEDIAPTAAFYTSSDEETYQIWPHHYEAVYVVSLMETDDFPSVIPEQVSLDLMRDPTATGKIVPGFSANRPAENPKEEEEEEEPVEESIPLQLRCVLQITNTDEKEMRFTAALQTHFSVEDLRTHGHVVRSLGLVGYALDWTRGPRKPRLRMADDDYTYFNEGYLDRIYVDVAESDTMLCPGDDTHFKIINRQGFTDLGVFSAGQTRPSTWNQYVAMPSARVGKPVKLMPGESWVGEMVIRYHDQPWPAPVWERDIPSETSKFYNLEGQETSARSYPPKMPPMPISKPRETAAI